MDIITQLSRFYESLVLSSKPKQFYQFSNEQVWVRIGQKRNVNTDTGIPIPTHILHRI